MSDWLITQVRAFHTLPEEIRGRIFVCPDSGCWLWSGGHRQGYGAIVIDGEQHVLHRWMYKRLIGPVISVHVLDHVACSTRGCCNPWHCEPVWNSVNGQRSGAVKRQRHKPIVIRVVPLI